VKKILCFFGTRPEAIKMAPVVRKLKEEPRFRVSIAVSAQHRDMLDQVLALFRLKSNFDLDLMRDGQSLFDVTAKVIQRFEPVLEKSKPDLVLVHGDTTTTLAGSLASYYKKIPVGHVEAGLRTRDKYQPFPEEINRRLTDSLATLHFAPTRLAERHLLDENSPPETIFVTGNTVIDALLTAVRDHRPVHSPRLKKILSRLQFPEEKIILMTAHRRENFGEPFRQICQAVRSLTRKFRSIHWIYPVHPNPNVRRPALATLGNLPNVHLVDPLDYADLVHVMKISKLVVTDSGGLQEEAPSLGKPVVVLRDVTERPEAVRAGTVVLAGTNGAKIIREVSKLLENAGHYRRMANAVNPYGDGRASERILQAIRWHFGFSRTRPSPFRARS